MPAGAGAMEVQPQDLGFHLKPTGFAPGVGALMTSREGGVSAPPFDRFNLRPAGLRGDAVDAPDAIAENHRRLHDNHGVPAIQWLDQVHGTAVVQLHAPPSHWGDVPSPYPKADASYTLDAGVACAVLVADCLPVLLAHQDGRVVGAAHAGWRGLAGGVVQALAEAMCEAARCVPAELMAWLGPCIGPRCFEVGSDVREAFAGAPPSAFAAGKDSSHWLADLPALARHRLAQLGIEQVSGGHWCTVSDARWYSFRRDKLTGRQAALIWREAPR